MRGRAALCVATTILLAGARVDAESPLGLTVRVYNATRMPAALLRAARAEAEPILRESGVDVTFRPCGVATTPGGVIDPCDDPLKPFEVVVRVIDAPTFNPSLHPHAYGVTYVAEETNRGWLATVFSDRIGDAAARVGLESSVLLGRVMAHEIGHLLLGRDYHGDAGVMRASWPDDLLSHDDAAEWRFSRGEAEAMQHVLIETPRQTSPR